MKHSLTLGITIAASLLATSAGAQNMRAGIDFRLNPAGKFKVSGPGVSGSVDTAVALGFAGHVDYVLTPNLMIGLMPQFLFNVKGQNGTNSATELDLMARIAGALPLQEVMLFAYVAPGYSFIFFPSVGNNDSQTSKGLVLDFGAGANYSVGEQVFLNFDVGYQVGFQVLTVGAQSGDVKTSFIHLGLGIGSRF